MAEWPEMKVDFRAIRAAAMYCRTHPDYLTAQQALQLIEERPEDLKHAIMGFLVDDDPRIDSKKEDPVESAARIIDEIELKAEKKLEELEKVAQAILPDQRIVYEANVVYGEIVGTTKITPATPIKQKPPAPELLPYLEKELQKKKYKGKTLEELAQEALQAGDLAEYADSLYMQAYMAALATKKAVEAAQEAGRVNRRKAKAEAKKQGAVMAFSRFPFFSSRIMLDAFSPRKIARLGELAGGIDERTGEVIDGDIFPLNAEDISYTTMILLNAIVANSAGDFREYFVKDGTIKFYVKGVLDSLQVSPRISNDGQLNLDRKTAGVLYLEKRLQPLLPFVGTIPDGSRYAVLNYRGYDAASDTMEISSPYLFQLWRIVQSEYETRRRNKALREQAGKKPLKADLKPLEINDLLKPNNFKEDDATLEIAAYITSTMLQAGARATETDFAIKTIISACPRLRAELEKIDEIEKGATNKKGKTINRTARYNSKLKKISKACALIVNPEKSYALDRFEYVLFSIKADKHAAPRPFNPTSDTITKSSINEILTVSYRARPSNS